MSLLDVNNVSVLGAEGKALDSINFRQERGERLVVAGETGSGKSTLLKVIAGLAHVDEGEVVFGGRRVEGPSEKLVAGHKDIAYLSQHFELPKFLRVEQVLQYANSMDDNAAEELYELCQIRHLAKRKTDELSGGERQRIALARLVSAEPNLLLLDEPYSHLDMAHKNTLKTVLDDIASTLDITFILVSHDPNDTLPWADRILLLQAGKMVQLDTATNIYDYPATDYCAGLFGKFFVPAEALRKTLQIKSTKKYLRPEDFAFTVDGIDGVVKTSRFFGSHFDCDVAIGDDVVVVRTSMPVPEGANVKVGVRD